MRPSTLWSFVPVAEWWIGWDQLNEDWPAWSASARAHANSRDALLAGSRVGMDARTLNESSSTTEDALRPPQSCGGAARFSEGWRFPDPIGEFGPGSISAFGVGSGGSHLVVHKGDTNIAESGKGTRSHFVDQSRLESQRNAWTSPASPYKSGALRKYADQIGLTDVSSVAQAGGKAEVVCLAAI
jgi:hypothetical protein